MLLRSFVFGLLVVVSSGFAAAAKPSASAEEQSLDKVLVTTVDAWIVIDAQGHPSGFGVDTKVPDALRASLERTALRWKFHPVLVEGEARAVRTPVRITLAAREQEGERYQVKVENVLFPANDFAEKEAGEAGAPRLSARRLNPPQYPKALQQLGISGNVLVAIRFNPDGSTAEVQATQSAILQSEGRDRVMRAVQEEFEKAALAAARRWQANVNLNGAAPDASNLTATVLVSFRMTGAQLDANDGRWRLETRGEWRRIAWLKSAESTQEIGVSDLRGGEMFPVATQFRFVEDVRGQSLM